MQTGGSRGSERMMGRRERRRPFEFGRVKVKPRGEWGDRDRVEGGSMRCGIQRGGRGAAREAWDGVSRAYSG